MSHQTPLRKRQEKRAWERRRFYWCRVETRYFLEQCLKRDALGQPSVVSRNRVFEQVSDDLRAIGFAKTAQQCLGKIRQMKVDYKRLGRAMLFSPELALLFPEYAQTDRPTSAAHANPGTVPSFVPAFQIQTRSVRSDPGRPSGSSSVMKSDLSEKIKNGRTENILDNSVVDKVNINQTKNVLPNDSHLDNILFKYTVFEWLNKIENNLNGTNEILRDILSLQKTQHTRLEKLLERHTSLLKSFAVINNFKQSNAET